MGLGLAEGSTISLVLGSGGARGMAHIGIIRELEERGVSIASIAGCSIGALVGGIYAAGKLDEFEEWVCAINSIDIVKLLDIAWEKNGLVKGDRVMDTLKELVGDVMIEDLKIPYTAVATDIARQREVWLNSGPLFDAIRASVSLPFLLTPYKFGKSLLIDGGVLNPVPIAPTFNDNTDVTIAVNLAGPPVDDPEALRGDDDDEPEDEEQSVIHRKLNQFIRELQESFNNDEEGAELSLYDVGNQAFDTMQGTIARQKLAAYPPDYTIEIPRNACGTLEFDLAKPMIALGRERAIEALGPKP